MKKFEYYTEQTTALLDNETLNEFGLSRWELVSVVFNIAGYKYFFKREIY